MRILLTCDPILPVPPVTYGGIERIVAALAGEFQARGHSVGLVAKTGSTAPVEHLFTWPSDRVTGVMGMLRNAMALRAAAREFRADLVHSFSRLAYLLPHLIVDRRSRAVMSYQRHTGPSQIRWSLRAAGNRLTFTGCSEFICNQGRAGGGRWLAIPNFVDTRKYDFAPHVESDAPLVFLSRIESIKGADLAIAIARKARRRLVLAGNRSTTGLEADYFEKQIAPWLGRDGIEWAGEVDDAAKNKLLGSAAALIVPIQWDEPFGIVFAEALATGTPVITCARGALPEIIEPDKTGFFIRDIEEGVQAVARLGQIDRRACRNVARSKFDLPVCAEQYLALYAKPPA